VRDGALIRRHRKQFSPTTTQNVSSWFVVVANVVVAACWRPDKPEICSRRDRRPTGDRISRQEVQSFAHAPYTIWCHRVSDVTRLFRYPQLKMMADWDTARS